MAWLGALFGSITAISMAVGGNVFLKQITNFAKYRQENNMGLRGSLAPLMAGGLAIGIPLVTWLISNRDKSQEIADQITINVQDEEEMKYGGF